MQFYIISYTGYIFFCVCSFKKIWIHQSHIVSNLFNSNAQNVAFDHSLRSIGEDNICLSALQLIRNAYGSSGNEVSACASRRCPSLRINKDGLSPVLACNYDGTKPGIRWIGDPSCLARRRESPAGRNQFGINVTSCGINVPGVLPNRNGDWPF